MENYDTMRKPWFKTYLQRLYSPVIGPWNELAARNIQSYVMGSYMNQPNTDKFNEHGRGNGLRYGVSCMQGWRGEMEDTHSAIVSLGQDRGIWRNASLVDWSYFGVFDGQAGDTASSYCADQLLGAIIYSPEFQEDIVKGIKAGFIRLDNRLRRLPDSASGKDKASSTAVCVLISPYNIYVAHCGDSRAVLCNDGLPVLETCDHKPSTPGERQRIENAGGTVTLTERLSGLLTVSRAFGAFRYKKLDKNPQDQIVSAEPEVEIVRRDRKDNFIILACNGVWDVMSTTEVCNYINHMMILTDDLEYVANSLINTCLYKGSKDNITVIIVAFHGQQKPNERITYLDKKVDIYIENKIKEILSRYKYISLSKVIENLTKLDIPYLPPGAGLSSKMHLVESIYNEMRPYHTDTALSLLNQGFYTDRLEEAILF